MKYVDNFLNGITMYKLVLYGLCVLVGVTIILGFLGFLPYSGMSFIYSILVLVITCWVSNLVLARIFRVQANTESYFITALILFFLLFPITAWSDVTIFVIAGVLAMASKYVLAIQKKHIFNPAAISAFILGLFGSSAVAWWVGGTTMLVPVVVLGFLVLRKVKRFELFFAFILTCLASIYAFGLMHGGTLSEIFTSNFISGPAFFFGMIMLTEPLTTPPSRKLRIIYGLIVGALFGVSFEIGPVYSTPELALIIGNLFSYIVSPRARLVLTLVAKNKLSADVYEFVWKSETPLKYKPGQYLEWTLGHSHADIRGNRRYFTISSSPTEADLRLGIKFYENSSSFKKKLESLEPGKQIVASQLSGDFTMPEDRKKKLVWIAGGIGVTPFRSMAKYLADKGEKRDAILFFSNRTPQDIVYKDIFSEAGAKSGLKTIYAVNDLAGESLTHDMRAGYINAEMITKEVPDYKDRMFYISGPRGMIVAFEDALKKMGVPRKNIKTDFFPGFV